MPVYYVKFPLCSPGILINFICFTHNLTQAILCFRYNLFNMFFFYIDNVIKTKYFIYYYINHCFFFQSKDKMVRGARRGCVRLRNAVVGIDDDDDSTFTITVDAKTFHFQVMSTLPSLLMLRLFTSR